jgi:hypothetical protein
MQSSQGYLRYCKEDIFIADPQELVDLGKASMLIDPQEADIHQLTRILSLSAPFLGQPTLASMKTSRKSIGFSVKRIEKRVSLFISMWMLLPEALWHLLLIQASSGISSSYVSTHRDEFQDSE